MYTFELNKVAGAFLGSLLFVLALHNLSNVLYGTHELEEPAYVVEGVEEDGAAAAATSEAPPEVPLAVMLASADVGKGERVARKCTSCHTFDEGGPTRTGPNLWGIVDRAKGTKDGFNYSPAMVSAGGLWSFDDLNAYLQKPRNVVPGGRMSFVGLKKATDRANILAYLRGLSGSPVPLPAVPEAPVVDASE